MQTRGLLPIIMANIVLSVIVAFGIIAIFGSDDDGDSPTNESVITFEVIVTATPDPNAEPVVITVVVTESEGDRRDVPDSALDAAGLTSETTEEVVVATADPALFDGDGAFIGEPEQLPPGCVLHTLADGENPSIVATDYGVDVNLLLQVNGLTEDDVFFLQIGQELIVPQEGCPVEQFISAQPTAAPVTDTPAPDDDDTDATITPEVTEAPTVIPTVTLAPTATEASVIIEEVISPGDITREAVIIRNVGNSIDIGGWTLSDLEGNTFTFPPSLRLFSNGGVTVFTRAGDDTPIEFYWDLDEAILQPGDVLTLTDDNGVVQSTLRLP
jgi:LysM repeat protein